jgi:Spy/CpxP family protein refolding chaperone
MIVRVAVATLIAGGFGLAALAQTHSPYAGHEHRAIAALSDQEIADLRSGAGMAMALPAELNGYPGPRHVLDLADRLGLTPPQHATAERLMATMRDKAVPLGEQVIAAETELGRLFASGIASQATIGAATERVARLRGELRSVHLVAHVAMRDVLSLEQRAAYDRLRGYDRRHKPH